MVKCDVIKKCEAEKPNKSMVIVGIKEGKAVIGRPIENVVELLDL